MCKNEITANESAYYIAKLIICELGDKLISLLDNFLQSLCAQEHGVIDFSTINTIYK